MINYSIIIPHYNTPDLLKRCIESIPERNDIEIIIVDDNSNPKFVDFKKFPGINKKNIKCIFNKKNKGAGISRNIAISQAKGKWILCVDADDFLLSDAFNIIDTCIRTDIDVFIFKSDYCLSTDISKKGVRDTAPYLNHLIDLYMENKITSHDILFKIMSPWCKLVRKNLIDDNNIKFGETKLGGEDIMWSVKLASFAHNISVINSKIYCLTEHDKSLTYQPKTFLGEINRLNILIEKRNFLQSIQQDKYIEFYTYQELTSVSQNNKYDFIKLTIKAINNKIIPPMCFYKIETYFKFRYPYLYLLNLLLGKPSLSRIPILQKIWRKLI